MGVAKLVASTSRSDAFVGFSGTGVQNNGKDTTKAMEIIENKKRSPPPTSIALAKQSLPAGVDSDQTPIQPLSLTRKKSSVDLHVGQATSLPARSYNPYNNPDMKLPRIDTTVSRPIIASRTHRSHSSPNTTYAPTVGIPMPPTPPDSAKGHRTAPSFDQRSTAETALGYLDSSSDRSTAFMEDLVGGYSAMEIDTPTRRPSLPTHSYTQATERVDVWAKNQSEVSKNDPSSRYRNASVPPSLSSSPVTSRQGSQRSIFPNPAQVPSNVSHGFQPLRRGALKDYRAATSRRNSVDDSINPQPMDMVSFRVKLHFQDEVRGMVC